MVEIERSDGRIERGNQTRSTIVNRTVEIASIEGLEALSIGRIANELELSKSGVFALFGSKQGLQLATIDAAIEIYRTHVVDPIREAPAGLAQLHRLVQAWTAYSKLRVFPGGCFFYSVSAEFDARRGAVHDAIAQSQRDWRTFVEHTITSAIASGELLETTAVAQLAFEIIALLEAANACSVLDDDNDAYAHAESAIFERLRAVAVKPNQLDGLDRIG